MKKIFFSSLLLISTTWLGCTHQDTKMRTVASPRTTLIEDNSAELQNIWSYDAGPSQQTEMGKELIDIVAQQPFMPEISTRLTGDQKFRPAFGPTLWRMIQKPNSIKILFIGQDGTHIAEAAGRTATAGFGGRAQDMAAHFGVEVSAAFMNTFAYTIKGQYAGRSALMVTEQNGKKYANFNNTIIDNGIWMMTHDQKSPMAKWRNSLIDWIIRNNKDSLKLVILFGGSARDSIGTFVESHGGVVGSRYSEQDIENLKIKVPRFTYESTGGNGEMPVSLMQNNKTIFQAMGVNIPFLDLTSEIAEKANAGNLLLKNAQNSFNTSIDKYYSQLALPNGGIKQSGLIHPAQIGGFDLNKITINGQTSKSLKGLKLSDGSIISNDILVADFPHPTALSSMVKADAEAKVEFSLATLKPFKASGWRITPDYGRTNKFDLADTDPYSKYKYGRGDIPTAYYDFGTPQNRMVSVSSAYRMPGYKNIVVIGSRDKAKFDEVQLKDASNTTKPDGINSENLFTSRPRTLEERYNFDAGPGSELAKIMKDNLNIQELAKMKNGKMADPKCRTPEAVSEFNIKTHPLCVGDFGHYRGLVKNPKVIILADPVGYDDILTSRALTGTRGQFIQNLMNKMGVNDQYLVIKTVPFGMNGATNTEWSAILKSTSEYRKKIFEALLSNSVKLIISDGQFANQEINGLINSRFPIVQIKRSEEDTSIGLLKASEDILNLKIFDTFTYSDKMANIPRSHLGFFSRVWEGTSGTRVFTGKGADEVGNVFAVVAPSWAYNQSNPNESLKVGTTITELNQKLLDLNLPLESEQFSDYLKRIPPFVNK